MKRQRSYKLNGRYTYVEVPTNRERFYTWVALIGTIGFTYGNMVSPKLWGVMEARAIEQVSVEQVLPVPTESVEIEQMTEEGVANNAIAGHDLPTTAPSSIEQMIIDTFGDQADNALKIAKCESGLNPENHGDKHLTSTDPTYNETIGDSIGLFQIRTGGKEINGKIWNRARANGMTAEEFRNYLKVPENNIRYAKTIFDDRGWNAWFNCMNKEL